MEIYIIIVFYFLIVIYSIVLHEVGHAVVALWLGDKTAKYAGRITLDPISHIDIFGSIIVPLILYMTGGTIFGWAKPVPYNPNNLRDKKWGNTVVALAGPATNFLLAFLASIGAWLIPISSAKSYMIEIALFTHSFDDLLTYLSGDTFAVLYMILIMIMLSNVVLGIFNLLPIPPLDGSKFLYDAFHINTEIKIFLERWGILILIILITLPPVDYLLSFLINSTLRSFLYLVHL